MCCFLLYIFCNIYSSIRILNEEIYIFCLAFVYIFLLFSFCISYFCSSEVLSLFLIRNFVFFTYFRTFIHLSSYPVLRNLFRCFVILYFYFLISSFIVLYAITSSFHIFSYFLSIYLRILYWEIYSGVPFVFIFIFFLFFRLFLLLFLLIFSFFVLYGCLFAAHFLWLDYNCSMSYFIAFVLLCICSVTFSELWIYSLFFFT